MSSTCAGGVRTDAEAMDLQLLYVYELSSGSFLYRILTSAGCGRSDRPISRRPANRGAALGWHISKRRLRRRCESNRPTQITACLEYRSTIRFHRAPIQATPKPYLRLHLVYGHKPTAAPVSLHLEQVFLRHLLHRDLHISTATHLAKDPTNLFASPIKPHEKGSRCE